MAASGKLSDVEAFRKQVYAREEESTTGIGEGIAIPHGKCDAVKKPGLDGDGHQKMAWISIPGRRTGPKNITPENLYELSQYCYAYLKSCYITRDAAVGYIN